MKGRTGICILLLSGLLPVFAQEFKVDSIKSQPYVELLYHSGIFWSRSLNLEEHF